MHSKTSSVNPRPKEKEEESCQEPYREAVDNLIWISQMTSPDITNVVREVDRHSQDPRRICLKVVLELLAYPKGTRMLGSLSGRGSVQICYCIPVPIKPETRKTEVTVRRNRLIMFAGAAVSRLFRKSQRCALLSSTEAEYVTMADAENETMLLRQVLSVLRPESIGRNIRRVFEDNEGALQLAKNPHVQHDRRTSACDTTCFASS